MSEISQESLTKSIQASFQPQHLEVEDTSGGCGQSFQILIVSKAFEGKTLLQRHRLVNDALKDQIERMHAFSQKCLTPEQYNSQK